jgi:hypothetical protein
MKILNTLFLFLFLVPGRCFSQEKSFGVFYVNTLPAQGVLIDKHWKFHVGDYPEWARYEFDDSKWEDINPTLDLHYLPQIRKASIGWLRIKLHVDTSLLNKPLAFQVYQSLASEIYWLNGHL